MCYYYDNNTNTIILVTDRLHNKNQFIVAATHELLHTLFLNHTEKPSIMHGIISKNSLLFPTKIDAQELIRVWGECYDINIEDFRYLKI